MFKSLAQFLSETQKETIAQEILEDIATRKPTIYVEPQNDIRSSEIRIDFGDTYYSGEQIDMRLLPKMLGLEIKPSPLSDHCELDINIFNATHGYADKFIIKCNSGLQLTNTDLRALIENWNRLGGNS